MEQEKSEVSRFIELKKYEQPDEGFFDDFLQDFQARQRQEMINVSARSLLKERVLTFLEERELWQWGAGAVAACASVTLGVMVLGEEEPSHYVSPIVADMENTSDHESLGNAMVDAVKFTTASGLQDTVSPLLGVVDVQFDFIDLNQANPSEDVEF